MVMSITYYLLVSRFILYINNINYRTGFSIIVRFIMALYSILLPTYNQSENLPILMYLLDETAKNNLTRLQIVVVDDNSPDGTGDLTQKLAKIFTNLEIKLVRRAYKMGLGSAYRQGLKNSTGQYVILMDSDLSHHPKYISQMISRQKETNADIVTGSRYKQGGGIQGWNMLRKVISRTANVLTTVLLGAQCSDFTGSFRLYRRSVIEELMAATKSQGYSFQMQMMVRAKRGGFKVEEVAIVFVDRIYGSSKLGQGEIVKYVKGLLQLFFQQ